MRTLFGLGLLAAAGLVFRSDSDVFSALQWGALPGTLIAAVLLFLCGILLVSPRS